MPTMLPRQFNSEEHDMPREGGLIPAGWYPAEITFTEMKDTKAGDGEYLEIEWTIIDGDFKGRKVWQRLNLVNPSEDAMRIAWEQLNGIQHAIGYDQPFDDAEVLHEQPCDIRLAVKKGKNDNPDKNDVKGCKPYREKTGGEGAPSKEGAGIAAAAKKSKEDKEANKAKAKDLAKSAPWNKDKEE